MVLFTHVIFHPAIENLRHSSGFFLCKKNRNGVMVYNNDLFCMSHGKLNVYLMVDTKIIILK